MSVKVFFNISVRTPEKIKDSGKKIFRLLTKFNCIHTYNCFENGVTYSTFENVSEDESEVLYKVALKSLRDADVIVLEISTNSFTQGYILQRALDMGKPVIALHQKNRYSIFVKGIKSSLLQTIEYDDYSLDFSLKEALRFAEENLICKFNFYLPADINNYLNWAAKKKNLPKSMVLRELIRSRMSQDRDYAT